MVDSAKKSSPLVELSVGCPKVKGARDRDFCNDKCISHPGANLPPMVQEGDTIRHWKRSGLIGSQAFPFTKGKRLACGIFSVESPPLVGEGWAAGLRGWCRCVPSNPVYVAAPLRAVRQDSSSSPCDELHPLGVPLGLGSARLSPTPLARHVGMSGLPMPCEGELPCGNSCCSLRRCYADPSGSQEPSFPAVICVSWEPILSGSGSFFGWPSAWRRYRL